MTPTPQSGGLLTSIRSLLGTVVGILQTRLELLATEVEAERIRVGAILWFGFLAVFFLGFGAVFLVITLTVLWWESHRLLALGIATGVFLVLGAVALYATRRRVLAGSRMFSASLAELAQDREALAGTRREP